MGSQKDLNIGLLAFIAAATLAMSGCGPAAFPRRCVDDKSAVVADEFCEDQDRRGPVATGGYYPFRWYYGGGSGYSREMFPGHPNLLETHLQQPGGLRSYVRKPLLSREGANITVYDGGTVIETGGDYGEEGYIFQALAPIPCIDGCYPVLGSWYITDQGPAGMGIRESKTLVTDNLSRFVPHYFD